MADLATINADIDVLDAENNTQAAKIAEALSLLNTKAAGGGGGGGDEWVDLGKTTSDGTISEVYWIAPEGKKFKRFQMMINSGSGGLSGTAALGLSAYHLRTDSFTGYNEHAIAKTDNVGTWAYTTIDTTFGEAFATSYCSNGGVTGNNMAAVKGTGAYTASKYGHYASVMTLGGARTIKLSVMTAGVVMNAGFIITAQAVYEDE